MVPPLFQALLLIWSASRWQVFLVALAASIVWLLFGKWRERQAQSWPVVQGTIEWTQVRVEGIGRDERRIPEVCYSYTVNDEYYSGSHEIFEADFHHYPKGSRILVHYKGSDPSVSFLDLRDMQAHEEVDEPKG